MLVAVLNPPKTPNPGILLPSLIKPPSKHYQNVERNASHLAGAALGVAIIHPDPGEKFQLMFDIGQAAAYMQLAAWELGIGSCLASIYEPDKARGLLGYSPRSVLTHCHFLWLSARCGYY